MSFFLLSLRIDLPGRLGAELVLPLLTTPARLCNMSVRVKNVVTLLNAVVLGRLDL